MTQAQLAWYNAMQEAGEMAAIRSREDLERHVALWQNAEKDALHRLPVGYLLSLEGADSLITIAHLERAYAQGLRAVGPANYGEGIYAQGTGTTGGFPPRGRELLARAGERRLDVAQPGRRAHRPRDLPRVLAREAVQHLGSGDQLGKAPLLVWRARERKIADVIRRETRVWQQIRIEPDVEARIDLAQAFDELRLEGCRDHDWDPIHAVVVSISTILRRR